MTAVRWTLAAAAFVALLLAALSNTETVTLRFLRVMQVESPLAFIVFVAFALGVAAGILAGAWRNVRMRRHITRLRHELRATRPAPAPHGAAPADRPPLDAL